MRGPIGVAMVHDVLHERYLRHGMAWYEARNARAQAAIGEKPQATEAVFDAMDDLAVGLERTGHADRAVEVMQRKLALLPPLPVQKVPSTQPIIAEMEADEMASAAPRSKVEYHHYTAHANLGTAMIHLSVGPAMSDNPAAKVQLREGLSHIHRAIAINPSAHFGRERWQAIAVQHILTAIDRPEFWTKYGSPNVWLWTIRGSMGTSSGAVHRWHRTQLWRTTSASLGPGDDRLATPRR